MRRPHRTLAGWQIALLIAAGCALLGAPAVAPPAHAAGGPPIKVGFSMPLSGDNAATGQKALNGAKLARFVLKTGIRVLSLGKSDVMTEVGR